MLWLLSLIALIAAITIAVVIFRHWKDIRLLDPDTIRAEQERKVRERIVRQRFDRRLRRALAPLSLAGRHAVDRLTRTVRQIEERLAQAAGAARHAAGADADEGGTQEIPEEIRVLLSHAEKQIRQAQWTDAERIYLEILKQDSRQIQAYRGLATLYLAQKQYPQAKETYKFLERIGGCDDVCYAGRADIAESEGEFVDAESFRKRAVEAAPRNAERHAQLAAFYTKHNSPEYAFASLRRASELDPKNTHFLERSVEAAILLRDRSGAEAAYARLQDLVNDQALLRRMRTKIDLLSAT